MEAKPEGYAEGSKIDWDRMDEGKARKLKFLINKSLDLLLEDREASDREKGLEKAVNSVQEINPKVGKILAGIVNKTRD